MTTTPSRFTPQVLFGLIVIAIGVLFTLDNLNIVDASDYLRYWPAALVALGVMKLWHARREGRGWVGGVIFTSVGAWMLLQGITYIRIDVRDFWPLMFVCMALAERIKARMTTARWASGRNELKIGSAI